MSTPPISTLSGTPVFQLTNAGLAAASVATPTGPWINIVAFQIGSGYGYTPLPTDLSITGELLYSGTPSSYQNVGDATIDILCEIPPNAGPFQFGEVALFLEGNVMFAKAVFPLPQNKFSALGTNIVSSYELHCLLTLAQGTAVFNVSTLNGPPSILQIFDWSAIYPPGISAYADVPMLQVLELSEFGDATILSNASPKKWSIEGATYQRYNQNNDTPHFSVANASSTWLEIAASELNPLDLTTTNERFVIETPDGYFRSVSSVITSGANYRFLLNGTPLQTVPSLGASLTIFRDDQAQGNSYYSAIEDPLYYDRTVLATNTGTTNAYAATYKQKNPVPYEGMVRKIDVGAATNTGASTFACDGGAPYPILGMANQVLQGGEIAGAVTLRFAAAGNWILVESVLGPLQIPNAIHSQQAVPLGQIASLIPPGASAGSGLTESGGQFQAYGLLQSPSQNTGRTLTSADDLNNFANPSGLYITYSAGNGYPANMPPISWDCQIWIHNNGDADITQIAYPMNVGGGDAQGNGGYPPYWRQGHNGNAWTNWFPMMVAGKKGSGGPVRISTITNGYTTTISERCFVHINVPDGNPTNSTNLYSNGNEVSTNQKSGGGGYGRYHHDSGVFYPGDVLLWTTTGGVGSPATMSLYPI
jgi:hypothetical protein